MKIIIKKVSTYKKAIINPYYTIDTKTLISIPRKKRVFYLSYINLYVPEIDSFESLMVVLHELGHIILKHYTMYNGNLSNIKKIKKECDAWSMTLKMIKRKYHRKAINIIWEGISNYIKYNEITKKQALKWVFSNKNIKQAEIE